MAKKNKKEKETIEIIEQDEKFARLYDNDLAKLKSLFVENYRLSFGNFTASAQSVGKAPRTVYGWLKNDPDFKREIKDIKFELLDFVENALFKKIAEGDTGSIIFYLKTKGRSRGYVESKDVRIQQISVNIPDLKTNIPEKASPYTDFKELEDENE